MRKLLNTLYITRPECYLHKERETVVIKQGDEKLGQFPMLALQNILCFGQVSVSPALMAACIESGVGLSFFTEFGKFQAQVTGMRVAMCFCAARSTAGQMIQSGRCQWPV